MEPRISAQKYMRRELMKEYAKDMADYFMVFSFQVRSEDKPLI